MYVETIQLLEHSILDEDFIVEETQPNNSSVSPASFSKRIVNRLGIISQPQPQRTMCDTNVHLGIDQKMVSNCLNEFAMLSFPFNKGGPAVNNNL